MLSGAGCRGAAYWTPTRPPKGELCSNGDMPPPAFIYRDTVMSPVGTLLAPMQDTRTCWRGEAEGAAVRRNKFGFNCCCDNLVSYAGYQIPKNTLNTL